LEGPFPQQHAAAPDLKAVLCHSPAAAAAHEVPSSEGPFLQQYPAAQDLKLRIWGRGLSVCERLPDQARWPATPLAWTAESCVFGF
jgi:hypothetical protein